MESLTSNWLGGSDHPLLGGSGTPIEPFGFPVPVSWPLAPPRVGLSNFDVRQGNRSQAFFLKERIILTWNKFGYIRYPQIMLDLI